jgi:hypothetical protein
MREAIKNSVRHSGCSRIRITLRVSDGEVYGLIEDDGGGFDPGAVGKSTPSWGGGLAVHEGAGGDTKRELARRLEAGGRHEGGAEGTSRRAVISPQRRKRLVEARYEGNIDTTLIPPRTQYGATQGKAGKRTPFRNAGFASLCNPLQPLTAHS